MKILVLNCGSSSIKFQLIETDAHLIDSDRDRCIARGSVEHIGSGEATLKIEVPPKPAVSAQHQGLDYDGALDRVIATLEEHHAISDTAEIEAVGHRMLHGGERFSAPVLIDKEVEAGIEALVELGPLHIPHNVRGYTVARAAMPGVPQVAVFDTAFHYTLPAHAYLYGLPYQFYERYHIRRYGFHGTSHRYVAMRYRKIFGKAPEDANLISIHLGNGCSLAAIKRGQSVDTSMGLTPQEGLLMGTRCGDIDSAAVLYLMSKEKLNQDEMLHLLNESSGLKGLSGKSNDMRELMAASEGGDARAKLAIDVFCYRIKKYIGAYMATLGHTDALIFTGGIGENAPAIRAQSCAGLSELGIEIDSARNVAAAGKEAEISPPASRIRVMVIPTNEELMIARDTFTVVNGLEKPH